MFNIIWMKSLKFISYRNQSISDPVWIHQSGRTGKGCHTLMVCYFEGYLRFFFFICLHKGCYDIGTQEFLNNLFYFPN